MRTLLMSLTLGLLLAACPESTPEHRPLDPVPPSPPSAQAPPPSAQAPPPSEGKGSTTDDAPAARVFDPSQPPQGVRFCRAKVCHTEDGRVLSYAEVMAEMGAERMVGGLDKSKLPPAPPDVAAPPQDALVSATGLATRQLKAGTGKQMPGPSSRVLVHYSGWTSEGEAFDSSRARGRPSAFPLKKVIPGWQEALQGMVAGERRRVWIPEELAYKGGEGGPAGVLVFDLELIKILKL